MTPLIESTHFPLLLTISGSSRNEPTQTWPKSPLSASTSTSRGACPVPVTVTLCGPNKSLLKIVTVAAFEPTLVGLNRTITSMEQPGATASG